VDRALEPADGKIVVAALEGELTVKRIRIKDGKTYLAPENDAFKPIEVSELSNATVWGVVLHVIHSF
jgi:DNA polymerase V